MNLFDLVAVLTLNKKGYDDGLNDAEKSASSFGKKLGSGLKTAAKVGTASLAMVGAGVVAVTKSLMSTSSEVAELGDHIDKQSQKIGISAKAYQEWDFILTHSGASVDSLQASMKTLSTQAEANAEEFEKLGISQEEVANSSPEELFERVIKGLQGMEESTERTAIAAKLLGRGATELAPVFNATSDDIEAMRQQAHELGKVLSDEAVKSGAAYEDSLYNLQTAIGGLKNKLGTELLPSIVNVMDGLTGLFTGDDSAVENLSSGIENLADNILKAIPKVAEVALKLVETLGDAIVQNLPTIMEKLVQMIPELAKAIGPLIEGLARAIMENIDSILDTFVEIIEMGIDYIVNNIDKIITGLVNLMMKIVERIPDIIVPIINAIPSILTSIVNAISENLPVIIEGLMGVIKQIAAQLPDLIVSIVNALPDLIQKLLDAVLDSLPIIIDGLIDVVLGIVNNLDKIIIALVKAVPKIISSIVKALLKALPQLIKGAIKLVIGLVKAIPQIISSLIQAIPEIISEILGAFGSLGEGIGEIFTGIFEAAGEILGPIGEVVSSIFNGIVEFLSDPFGKIKEFFTGIYTWAEEKLQAVSDFFSSIWEGFKNFLSGPLEAIEGFFESIWETCKRIMGWVADKVGGVFQGIKDFLDWINPFSDSEPQKVARGTTEKFFGIDPSKYMASGGVLEKGQVGFLEGNGAEAVVPLENNAKWIHAVARDMQTAMGGTVNHTGTITLKGVNNRGEFVASADYVIDELLAGLRQDARLAYG